MEAFTNVKYKRRVHQNLHLRLNSDSRPGVVFSITGLSNTPPLDPVADTGKSKPRYLYNPLQE